MIIRSYDKNGLKHSLSLSKNSSFLCKIRTYNSGQQNIDTYTAIDMTIGSIEHKICFDIITKIIITFKRYNGNETVEIVFEIDKHNNTELAQRIIEYINDNH
tara:strand:- start:684 stop:989 length:306 start_codon:yes stop_codon:yes gene_type:complete